MYIKDVSVILLHLYMSFLKKDVRILHTLNTSLVLQKFQLSKDVPVQFQ